MEQYSRRFIEELANHIDPVIIDYFNKKKNLLHFSESFTRRSNIEFSTRAIKLQTNMEVKGPEKNKKKQ